MALMHQRNGNRRTTNEPALSFQRGMSTPAFVAGLMLWCLVLAALWSVVAKKRADQSIENGVSTDSTAAEETETDADVNGTSKNIVISFPSRELPDFELPECMGGTVSRESLRGKRWVANFVFTHCAGPCSTMTRDMSQLHQRVAKSKPDFRFVTFTVDPTVDTPDVLKKYADLFLADHDRWKFVTGDEEPLYDLIRRGFVQVVIPEVPEKRIPGFEIAHSNRAVLVNEDCIPVATFLMNVPEDVVKLRRIIEGKEEFPKPVPGLAVAAGDDGNAAIQLNLVPVGNVDQTDQTDSSDPPEARNDRIDQMLPDWVARMPSINAALNSVCTVLLIAGFVAIKNRRRTTHRNLMISAFLVSVVFLACYLTYHQALYRFTGQRGRAFIGSELATRVYWCILIPHVILAAVVPILALRVFWLAWRERWSDHRRLATITLPVWLFVSITGVVIYVMLYHWPWKNAALAVCG